VIAVTACLALLAGAADESAIRIGLYAPLTGGSATMGVSLRNGARLAVEEIDAASGVLGRQLVLVERDDEGNPTRGAQLVHELVEKERVHALLGPANTGVANVSTSLASERHVPHVIPVATGNKVNELFREVPQNYVFRFSAADSLQSSMIVTEAFAARGKRRPAILYDETPYGEQGRARLEAELAKRGVTPVYAGLVRIGQQDASAHVQAARAAGADVLLLYVLGAEGAAVARALEKAAWRVDVIGTWILNSPAFVQNAGRYGEGTIFPQTFIEAGATEPRALRFISAYRKRFGVERIETAPAAAQAYDAVHLLTLAIAQAGTTNGPKVKAAMEDLSATYEGATGEYFKPWAPDDHEAVTPANVAWGVASGGWVAPAGIPVAP
jgi:branched-chain amino acid transport system substrate-binding protein